MILVLKKRKAILLLLFLVTLIIFAAYTTWQLRASKTFLPVFGKTVIVDAGHGAPDGGAVGKSGIEEKDLNLAVSLKLQQFLEQGGTKVILTRSDDNGIYDVSGTIRSKKNSDMKNREKLMEESGADIFVSIHMNNFSDSQYSGPQVFFSSNNEKSEVLARMLQKSLLEGLKPPSVREIKKAGADIYLLKQAKLPAVLVECGFLSNRLEEQKLLDNNYQTKVAWSLYCGIINYFNEN